MILPQGLCTCPSLYLEHCFLSYPHGLALTTFKSRLNASSCMPHNLSRGKQKPPQIAQIEKIKHRQFIAKIIQKLKKQKDEGLDLRKPKGRMHDPQR